MENSGEYFLPWPHPELLDLDFFAICIQTPGFKFVSSALTVPAMPVQVV